MTWLGRYMNWLTSKGKRLGLPLHLRNRLRACLSCLENPLNAPVQSLPALKLHHCQSTNRHARSAWGRGAYKASLPSNSSLRTLSRRGRHQLAMAKAQLLAALCVFSALLGVALATSPFVVHGRVYCDTCRAGFETSATQYIQGAKVKLECRHFSTGEVAHSQESVTDATGTYKMEVIDDHEEEICEVVLLESPVKGCSEINVGRDRARIVLTNNSGMASMERYANTLGFLKDEPLPFCGELLRAFSLGD